MRSSQPDKGTSTYIFLPRAEDRQGMETPPAGAQAPAYVGGATILLFDADNAVREVTAAMLRDFGYVVHEVGSGGAALDFLERVQNIDLMLIDFAMPGMSGADVARRVHMCAPSLPTLFVTGFARSNGRQREPRSRAKFGALSPSAVPERCTFSRLAPLSP